MLISNRLLKSILMLVTTLCFKIVSHVHDEKSIFSMSFILDGVNRELHYCNERQFYSTNSYMVDAGYYFPIHDSHGHKDMSIMQLLLFWMECMKKYIAEVKAKWQGHFFPRTFRPTRQEVLGQPRQAGRVNKKDTEKSLGGMKDTELLQNPPSAQLHFITSPQAAYMLPICPKGNLPMLPMNDLRFMIYSIHHRSFIRYPFVPEEISLISRSPL